MQRGSSNIGGDADQQVTTRTGSEPTNIATTANISFIQTNCMPAINAYTRTPTTILPLHTQTPQNTNLTTHPPHTQTTQNTNPTTQTPPNTNPTIHPPHTQTTQNNIQTHGQIESDTPAATSIDQTGLPVNQAGPPVDVNQAEPPVDNPNPNPNQDGSPVDANQAEPPAHVNQAEPQAPPDGIQIEPPEALAQMVSQRIPDCLRIIKETQDAPDRKKATSIYKNANSEYRVIHCPLKHQGNSCPCSYTTMTKWYKHVQLEHTNNAAKVAITKIMTDAGLAKECDQCNVSWSFWDHSHHYATCRKKDATSMITPTEPVEQIQELDLAQVQSWPWSKLTQESTAVSCQPNLVCNKTIHQHVLAQIKPILASLDNAASNNIISDATHMRVTIFLLQAILSHPKQERAKLQLKTQAHRLRLFKSGRWCKLKDLIAERMLDTTDMRSKTDIVKDVRKATINGGKVRATVLAEYQPHIISQQEFEDNLRDSQFPKKPNDAASTQPTPNQEESQAAHVIEGERLKEVLQHMTEAVGPTALSSHIWKQVYEVHKYTVQKFIHRIVSNKVPPCIHKILTGVNYSVLKRIEDDKMRAVGSMDSLVKIAAKYLDSKHIDLKKSLIDGTTEYAVGTPYATAKIATRLITEIKDNANDPNFAIMKIDIKGAYPTASRHHMLQIIQQQIPAMTDFFKFLYGQNNTHHMTTTTGATTFEQEWGLIQGAESSAFFFSLLTQSQLNDQTWIDCLMRYVDDFFLFGPIASLQEKHETLTTNFEKIGLKFAPDKTKIFLPHANQEQRNAIYSSLPDRIKYSNDDVIQEGGIKILGIPIGKDGWVRQKLSDIATRYVSDLEKIKSSCTHQQVFKVLQLSASVFQHIIAVIPPQITDEFCTKIDHINVQNFKQLYIPPNVQLSDTETQWLHNRIHLPVRHNGMGLLALKYRNRPAFISTAVAIHNDTSPSSAASWAAYTSCPQMKQYLDEALRFVHQWRINRVTSFNQTASPQDQQAQPQQSQFTEISKQCMQQWMQPLFEILVKRLKTDASPRQLQLLTAMENKGTRIILTAWPNRQATRLDNDQMKHAICHRMGVGLKELLGMDIESYESKCLACNSGALVAEHMNSCRSTRIKRHDTVVTCTQEMLEDAGIHGVLEKRVGIVDNLGERKKIDIWFRNQMPINASQTHVMADVTVIQAFSTTNTEIPDTVKLMKAAATKKRATYASEALALSAVVQPLVFNTLGAMHTEVDSFIKGMAKFAEQNQTYYPSVNLNFNVKWRQNFAFQVARSTADAAYGAMQRHFHGTSLVSRLAI